MQQFFLLEDFDQMEVYEVDDYVSQEKNILQDFAQDYSCYVDIFLSKNLNPTIDHHLRKNALNNYEIAFGLLKQEAVRQQLQSLYQSYNQFQPDFRQKNNLKDSVVGLKAKQQQEQGLNHDGQNSKKTKGKKASKIKKYDKNQYDKNIPGNIVLTVAKYILKLKYKPQVEFYCTQLKTQSQDFDVTYSKVVYFATTIKERKHKFGTSQLGHLFHDKKGNNGMEKVFGLFMTRFLKEQYTLHILSVGKMSNKYKYLEYATNMLYIPRLRKEEYALIRQFRQKDV